MNTEISIGLPVVINDRFCRDRTIYYVSAISETDDTVTIIDRSNAKSKVVSSRLLREAECVELMYSQRID